MRTGVRDQTHEQTRGCMCTHTRAHIQMMELITQLKDQSKSQAPQAPELRVVNDFLFSELVEVQIEVQVRRWKFQQSSML